MIPQPNMGPPPGFATPHNAPPLSVTYPSNLNFFPSGYKYSAKLQQKTTKAVLPSTKKALPTLEGFNYLRTLSVLDMDTLDYVGELRTCIRNCSSTLTSLTLSFSEALASKSREPPPEVHSDDDSEVEDEFGQLIPPPGPPPPGMVSSSSDPNAPTKALKAKEERKRQEDVLHRIFGLQTGKKSKPIVTSKVEPDVNPPKPKVDEDPKLRFLRSFGPIAQKLMSEVKPGSEATPEAKKALELIKTAAKMYVDEVDRAKEKPSSDESSSKGTPSTTSADSMSDDNVVMSGGGDTDDGPGLFDDDASTKKKGPYIDPEMSNPDDIDIEEPEGKELTIDFDDPSTDAVPLDESPPETTNPNEPADAAATNAVVVEEPGSPNSSTDAVDLINKLQIHEQLTALVATHSEIHQEGERLKQRMVDMQLKMQATDPTSADFEVLKQAEAQFKQVSVRVNELSRNMLAMNELVNDVSADARSMILLKTPGNEDAKMSEYVRSTRGLILHSLAIYLIPVRAMVLNTAIDLHALQSLTLLNVGPQVSIWTMLRKENATSPLPLSKIYTDNVTTQFLQCVGELDKVTELLLLEKQKGRVESTAVKTTVKMEKIRKEVLKKHACTLKVLTIKNDSSSDWDLDVKATLLLCYRAKQLEELSASFGLKTMVCCPSIPIACQLTIHSTAFYNPCLE
jgi:hypothetical protein